MTNLHPLKDSTTGRHHGSLKMLSSDALRANYRAAASELVRLNRYHVSAMRDGSTVDVDRLLDLQSTWRQELRRRGEEL